MATQSEMNQFRRYIGDFHVTEPAVHQPNLSSEVIDAYLDDAARQVSSSQGKMVTVNDFDTLDPTYKSEVIVQAAINYWWNRAAEFLEKHNITVGQASVDAGSRYDRALLMIERLEAMYKRVAVLGTEISINHISRFSKHSLRRVGGQREEDALGG